MSPTRIEPKLAPIELDLSAAFSFEHDFGRAELLGLGPQLETARAKWQESIFESNIENSSVLAQLWLSRYEAHRKRSVLGQILAVSKQLREAVDRVVVLAPPQFTAAAAALFAACCHPLHNELSRGQRGGRPRIYLLPAVPDNDAVQALLELLPQDKLLTTVDDRWGLVAAGDFNDGGGDELLTGLFALLWDMLQTTTTANDEKHLAAAVAAPGSTLATLSEAIGISRVEQMQSADSTGSRQKTLAPNAVDPVRQTISTFPAKMFFQPGVLLAAAVMGMDIVKLLRGAAAMTKRFAEEPPGNNPVLDFAGLSHLLAVRRGIHGRRIETIAAALLPLTAHFSHPQSESDLLVQLAVQAVRHDRVCITMPQGETASGHPKHVARKLVDFSEQQETAVKAARMAAAAPTATIRLPLVDESTVGQLIALFSLSEEIQTHLAT